MLRIIAEVMLLAIGGYTMRHRSHPGRSKG
jgi:hypothetical protein